MNHTTCDVSFYNREELSVGFRSYGMCTILQGPLQVTSQLSGATQGPSSEVYRDESGEEEAKSDSTSWKTTRRSSAERDSCGIRSSSSNPNQSHNNSEELKKSTLNLQVACSVQSTGVNTASEEEVNQQTE